MTVIYICKIKLLGFPFAVVDEQLAKQWVEQDPESHYYETVPVQTTV